MPISRRPALNSFAAAIGLADTTTAAIASPSNALPTSSSPHLPVGPARRVTLEPTGPITPSRIPNLTSAEQAEYERMFRYRVRETTYQAAIGLGIARAWYKRFPEVLAMEEAPELFEWVMREDGTAVDVGIYDDTFGPLSPNLAEESRKTAERNIIKRRQNSR